MGRLYFEFPTREQRWKGVQCKSYWVKATQLTLLDSEICNSWKKKLWYSNFEIIRHYECTYIKY